jgi:hypothetical protein
MCTKDYFNALEDPFDCAAVCVPAPFSPPSQKVFFRSYTSMLTGVGGVGFVVFSPGTAITTSDCAYFTTSAYTGTSVFNPYTGGVGINNAATNSLYAASVDGDSYLSCRIVSSGLRIRNVTPLMTRGAYVVGYESPQHSSLLSTSSASDVNVLELIQWQNDEVCERVNSDSGDWISVAYHPVAEEDLDYVSLSQSATQSTTIRSPGNFYLGFWVQASSSSTQTFEVEFVVSAEFVGTSAVGTTPSESDPQGLALVNNITSITDVRKPRVGDRLPVLKRILNGARAFTGFAADFLPIAKGMLALL